MAIKTLDTRLVQRNRTAAAWTAEPTYVLLKGEIGIEIDTRRVKIGDGVKTWAQLAYANVRPEDLVGLGYGDMLASKYATIDAANGYVDKAKSADSASHAATADEATSAGQLNADHVTGGIRVVAAALDVNESDPSAKLLVVTSTDADIDVSATNPTDSSKVTLHLNGAVHIDSLGNVETKTVKKTGGTASQFLKADGSVDSKVYIESSGAPVQSVAGKTGAVSLAKGDVGLGNVDNTSDAAKEVLSATKLKTARKINGVDFDGTGPITITAVANGGNADTVDNAHVGTTEGTIPVLGTSGKILPSMLPDYILGQLLFGGTIDAAGVCTLSTFFKNRYSITTLTLAAGNAATYEGAFFLSSANAASGVPSSLSTLVGDWVVSLGGSWAKIDNTDAVASVNGKTGVVTLTKADVGLGNVDNTSDANKPVSSAQQSALDLKVSISGGNVAQTIAAFTQAGTRANIVSGESLATIFGKLMKWFADLKTVAFTGAYGDLTGNPTLGTAAAKNVAASGNAAATEVVMGNDGRLSDTRTPTDLSVSTGKIIDKAVTAGKMADSTITDDKMAPLSLNVTKLFIAAGDTLIINGSF